MLKNYLFLKRFLSEIDPELTGLNAVSVFSQEKDKIVFQFPGKFLEISANPGTSYITLKENFSRAKKNTIGLFTEYFPSKLNSVQIAEFDRIIRFNFEKAQVYFFIRGKFTNVILVYDKKNMIPFKKTTPEFLNSFFEEIRRINFISPSQENYFDFESIGKENFIPEIKNKYPLFGSDLILEIKRRNRDNTKDEFTAELKKIINELQNGIPAVFINRHSKEIKLAADSFKLFSGWESCSFGSIKDAFNFYLKNKMYLDDALKNELMIKKNIEKELARLSSKLNSLKFRLETGSREEEYNKTGSLLLININSIKKGMKEIELEDVYNENKKIKIKLNEEYPPKANINHYFDLAKKERVSFEKSGQLLKELKNEFQKLKRKEEEFKSSELQKEKSEVYDRMKKALGIKGNAKSGSAKDDPGEKFKHYIIEKKYHVYVGKDSVNNDLLTTKFAKQNDYWFHARGVSGSHLVLRVESSSIQVPKNILKAAASIAAFHSKSKTSGLAPVSFTQKKYVVKKKGMEPGKVVLLREEVLIVKPEIPKSAEFISRQLE